MFVCAEGRRLIVYGEIESPGIVFVRSHSVPSFKDAEVNGLQSTTLISSVFTSPPPSNKSHLLNI